MIVPVVPFGMTTACSTDAVSTAPPAPPYPAPYQAVPSGGSIPVKPTVFTTPIAIEPVVQKQAVQVPQSEVEKTKNTVTTTTIRSGS